jgi:hypothetical protein
LLSNKIYYIAVLLIFALFLSSCGKKKKTANVNFVSKFKDPAFVLKETKDVLGPDTKFAKAGTFDKSAGIEAAGGTEVSVQDQWGIKFFFLKLEDDKLKTVFETNLLKGSFNGCLVNKIKFPQFNYELVYYNSQDYFLGSGGGEIFSYVINFNEKQVYYAHLVIEQGKPTSVFISDNTKQAELIREFFLANFKRDYPTFQIVDKDINVE